MASLLADTVVMLADGGVSVLPREAARERFAGYFESVTFLQWSDLEPPAVRLARSGELATVRVRRRVRLGVADSAGRSRPEHTVFAWTETWRRSDGAWEIVSVTSTEREGREDVAAAERAADPGAAAGGAARAAEEILARARSAVAVAPAATPDSVRAVAFVAAGSGPGGPFRTAVRSGRDGRIALAQRTSAGEVVRREVGPLVGGRDRARDDAAPGASGASGADRAFLEGHALLHLALDPTAVLGAPARSGRMTFAGVEADVLVFRDAAGRPLDLVYERSSGRLLGARIRGPSRPGETILLYLSGWRADRGLLLPRRAVFLQGGDLYLYRLEEVRVDPPEGASLLEAVR